MTKNQIIRLQNFAMLIGLLSLLGVLIFGLLHTHAIPAKASARPQWNDIAGDANHACYHDGGVQQINYTYVFVCRDGWAMEP